MHLSDSSVKAGGPRRQDRETGSWGSTTKTKGSGEMREASQRGAVRRREGKENRRGMKNSRGVILPTWELKMDFVSVLFSPFRC